MKNLKPFILGSFAGAGIMFVMLQYHVIRSHDGFQLVPRTPRPGLGLAYLDVRDWSPQQWTEQPQVGRALMAHGASDLIAESVTQDLANRLDPDGGTIGELRDLLNGEMSVDSDAPLFGDEPHRTERPEYDLTVPIPFNQESRRPSLTDRVTQQPQRDTPQRTHIADRSRDSVTDSGGGLTDPFGDRGTRLDSPFSEPEFSTDTASGSADSDRSNSHSSQGHTTSNDSRTQSGRAAADRRRRETDLLEDMLFSDSDTNAETNSSDPLGDPVFDSFTRAMDSRASQALDRAAERFNESMQDMGRNAQQQTQGFVRDIAPDLSGTEEVLPESVRRLRESFDPFLDLE